VEGSYDAAFAGADAVVHTAAVVEVLDSKNAEEKILKPSLEGSKNVLGSVRRSGSVRRLVYTSSVAAVQSAFGLDASHVFTEDDWNGWSTLESDAYGFAKAAAERMLWSELQGDAACDLVSLCPAVVLGPCLTKAHTKTSTVLVREAMFHNPMNSYYASFVDVRDVAAACLAALTVPAAGGKRFIVVGDEPPMLTTALADYAAVELPQYSFKGAAKYSEWLVWLLARLGVVAPFQEAMSTKKLPFSNAQLKAVLGVAPRTLGACVKDTAVSMIEGGWVKPKSK